MKILHTADWHLGKRLDHFSRFEEQVEVMDEIVKIADEQEVDMVLIAGDLFDTFHPGVEAIELFYKTMKRLSKGGQRPVIAIAGNHDSPSFIDAPDPLARECGIILIGYPQAEVRPFRLEKFEISKSAAGFIELILRKHAAPVRIIHTPYANELRLKKYFGEQKEAALNKVLANHWEKIACEFCDNKGVNLLIAHLYMNRRGGTLLEEPEGEKPLKIGNADMIFSDAIPKQIQYTALGHLHKFNNIGSPEQPVVYASSPLCYSFGEAGQKKQVCIIDTVSGKAVSFERRTLQKGRPLARKKFDDIEKAIHWLRQNTKTLVELTIESESFLKAEDQKRLFQAHEGIIQLIPRVKGSESGRDIQNTINLNQDIYTLFQDYFRSENAGQAPNEELMALFKEVLNLEPESENH